MLHSKVFIKTALSKFRSTAIRERNLFWQSPVIKSALSSSSRSYHRNYNTKMFNFLRGDTIIALGIPIGCIGLLVEAYYRTDHLADADEPKDCQFTPCQNVITNEHVRELEQNGIVVIQNVISKTVIDETRHDIIRKHHQQQQELMTGNTSQSKEQRKGQSSAKDFFTKTSNTDDVRQDKVAWVHANDNDSRSINTDTTIGGALRRTPVSQESNNINNNSRNDRIHNDYCVRFIRGITYELERHMYDKSTQHLVPQNCQLAMYVGDGKSIYKRHLDRCNETIYNLGLLEYLRLSDYRSRVITVILYLNSTDRNITEGGSLRCWVKKRRNQKTGGNNNDEKREPQKHNDNADKFYPSFDVEPTGGTLVIFQSDRVEHMVLPSITDRYALTNWISGALVD